jgi:formamidopyrimidine-DNA glycosylase
VPELPDISAYLAALEPRILGQPIQQIRIASPFLLRTAQPPITDANGRAVRRLRRIGKRIAFGLDGELWIVLHLMIAGRLHWKPAGAKVGGRNNLAASIHVVSGEDGLRSLDPGGLEIFSSDFAAFKAALTAENRTLKRALTDPRILSGIGNAYSDEILHAAKLSPIKFTHKLEPEEWDRLYAATKDTLTLWTDRLIAEAKLNFPEKVTAFRPDMAVHGRYRKPCPRCAQEIQRIRYADNETNYCPHCQTNNKLLADRSLSRLLGKDWPRTLDELESLRRR